jgi:alpha-methylacyl-CoA racemase
VLSIPEVATDVQYAARGAVTTAEHPEKGGFQQTAPLLAGMVKHEGPYAIPDGTTATDELLSAAGYSTKQIDELRESGAVA